jgi:hypothetical protein
VLQLPGVHHRLVRPEPVPGPVLLAAEGAHVVAVGLARVRDRIVRIDPVLEPIS